MSKKSSKVFNVTLSIVLSVILMVSSVTSVFAISYDDGSDSYKKDKYYKALTKVKLTGDRRKDIVNIAKSQIGYHEGKKTDDLSGKSNGEKNYTEYGFWYGNNGDSWCAMFVSWCANLAGVSTNGIPKTDSTVIGLSKFKKWERAHSRVEVAKGKYKPKAGDIIYFKGSRNNNETNHVGIVTKYSNGIVYTIEGNTSKKKGGADLFVAKKSHQISNTDTNKDIVIVYICSPDYYNFHTLKNGSKGYRVKALQYMLNYHVKAKLSVDGKFGEDTKKAVIKLQKSKNLKEDGIVGVDTWKKLTSVKQSKSNNKPNLTKAIQVLLNNKASAKLSVNGKFNDSTRDAVIDFQKSNNIKANGVVNAKTWKYLLS